MKSKSQLRNTGIFIIIVTLFCCFHFPVSARDNYEESQILFNDHELPVINVTIDPDSLAWLLAEENLENRRYLQASVHYISSTIDSTVDPVGFRLRGNTSRYSAKKSFKISFNEFEGGRKFYGLDKFNLNGEHNDPSIIRSKLGWDLCNTFGLPASRSAHVMLYINGEYRGLYIHVEEYDKTFLETRFNNNTGNFYKCLWPADMVYLGANQDLYKMMLGNRRVYDLRTNRAEDDYSDLVHLIDIINNSDDQDFVDSVEACFNTFDFLKSVAMEVIIGHWDDYWINKNNFFLYNNAATGKFEFITFDIDNTFGVLFNMENIETRNIYQWGNRYEDRPMVDNLLAIPQYHNLYSYFLATLIEHAFSLEFLEDRIYEIRDMISDAAENDHYRTLDYGWNFDDFLDSYTLPLGGHVTTGLLPYIDYRNSSANIQLNLHNIIPVFRGRPVVSYNASLDQLTVSLSIFDESIPAEVMVEVADGENFMPYNLVHTSTDTIGLIPHYRYEGIVAFDEDPGSISIYFEATDIEGIRSTFPRHAPDELVTIQLDKLYINEFLAANETIIQDESGEFDDWVEIYNDNESALNLSGWYLTDDPGAYGKWAFPDTTIEPNEHLLVWCDDEEEQGPLHTSFRLNQEGEYIGLSKSNRNIVTIIDTITYTIQTADVSYGRYPDGTNNWIYDVPTPGAANNQLDVTDSMVPVTFPIFRTWPNPFNSLLKITYTIPEYQFVNINVYDVLGRKVDMLQEGWVTAGDHQLTWNPENLASGIYLVVLKSSTITASKKIVQLK